MKYSNILLLPLKSPYFLAQIRELPRIGNSLFYCLVIPFLRTFDRQKRVVPKNSNVSLIREWICAKLSEDRDTLLTGLNMTAQEYFDVFYGPSSSKKEILRNPSLGSDQEAPSTYDEYVQKVKDDGCYPDNLIIAFAAALLKVNIKVLSCRRIRHTSAATDETDVYDDPMEFELESVKSFLSGTEQSASSMLATPKDIWNSGEWKAIDHEQDIILIELDGCFQFVELLQPKLRIPDIDLDICEESPGWCYSPPRRWHCLKEKFFHACEWAIIYYGFFAVSLHVNFNIKRGTDLCTILPSFLVKGSRWKISAFIFDDSFELKYSNDSSLLKIVDKLQTTNVHCVVIIKC